MSTTPVTDTRVTVSDRPVPNQSVVAELGGTVDGSWRVLEGRAADGHVVGRERVLTDSSGHWVLPLIPNSEIIPTGTTYRLTEPSGQHFIIVPVAQIDADGKAIPVSAGDLYTVDPPQPVMPLPGQGPAGPPFVVKGDVANQAALPTTGEPGQGWVTSDTGHVWAWDPAVPGWVDAGQFQGIPGVGLEYRWNGDQLEVRREGSTDPWDASPHLSGGDGAPGAAATIEIDPASGGVPNGTPTSVTNTGTASAAKLKILVEQGAPGDPGAPGSPTAFELRGTGFPEGVVTASPGTYYTDTAGTNGAWRWLKTSGLGAAGWVVTVGDTGWRYLDSTYFPNFANTDGGIRRINNRIHLLLSVKVIHYNTDILSVPTGFLGAVNLNVSGSAKLSSQVMLNNEISDSSFVFAFDGSVVKFHGKNVGTDGAATTQFARISWAARNSEPWPANLPGVPVIPS